MATSGDLTTFGTAIEHAGLNPHGFVNNCVSVAVAHLEWYDNVHELWQAIYNYQLPDGPLQENKIRDMLGLTGWKYSWKTFYGDKSQGKGSAFEQTMAHLRDVMQYDESGLVLFRRPDGSGHAVNFHVMVPQDWKTPFGFDVNFVDFQLNKAGEFCQEDVSSAVQISVLLRSGAKDGGAIDGLFEALEDRKARLIKRYGGRLPFVEH